MIQKDKLFIMLKSKYLILPLALSISACSNKPPRPEMPEIQESIFSTQIMSNGEKKFNLHIPMANQTAKKSGSRGSSQGGGRQGPPPGGNDSGGKRPRSDVQQGNRVDRKEQQKDQLEQRLQDELYTTQYCRDSYKIRDTYIGFSFQVITGECIDLANDEDRKKFPNEEGTDIR